MSDSEYSYEYDEMEDTVDGDMVHFRLVYCPSKFQPVQKHKSFQHETFQSPLLWETFSLPMYAILGISSRNEEDGYKEVAFHHSFKPQPNMTYDITVIVRIPMLPPQFAEFLLKEKPFIDNDMMDRWARYERQKRYIRYCLLKLEYSEEYDIDEDIDVSDVKPHESREWRNKVCFHFMCLVSLRPL